MTCAGQEVVRGPARAQSKMRPFPTEIPMRMLSSIGGFRMPSDATCQTHPPVSKARLLLRCRPAHDGSRKGGTDCSVRKPPLPASVRMPDERSRSRLRAREFERSLEEGVHELSSLFHLSLIRRAQGDNAGADELLRRAGEFGKLHPTASEIRR